MPTAVVERYVAPDAARRHGIDICRGARIPMYALRRGKTLVTVVECRDTDPQGLAVILRRAVRVAQMEIEGGLHRMQRLVIAAIHGVAAIRHTQVHRQRQARHRPHHGRGIEILLHEQVRPRLPVAARGIIFGRTQHLQPQRAVIAPHDPLAGIRITRALGRSHGRRPAQIVSTPPLAHLPCRRAVTVPEVKGIDIRRGKTSARGHSLHTQRRERHPRPERAVGNQLPHFGHIIRYDSVSRCRAAASAEQHARHSRHKPPVQRHIDRNFHFLLIIRRLFLPSDIFTVLSSRSLLRRARLCRAPPRAPTPPVRDAPPQAARYARPALW